MATVRSLFFPEISISPPKEDICDGCYAIETELSNPYLTQDRREFLMNLKQTHIQDAIVQRRAMQAFIKQYVKNIAPEQPLPEMLLPDLILEEKEDDEGVNNFAEEFKFGTVLVQGEDFGGGIGMLHYGSYRPSTDYYNSNLIMNNFVIADIVAAVSRIYFYDERGQDKGADALCTLRMLYHLSKLPLEPRPESSVSILDNCVGQNKSQVLMKFFAMLSVLLYDNGVVALLYLLSGHIHELPDRATAHRAADMKNQKSGC